MKILLIIIAAIAGFVVTTRFLKKRKSNIKSRLDVAWKVRCQRRQKYEEMFKLSKSIQNKIKFAKQEEFQSLSDKAIKAYESGQELRRITLDGWRNEVEACGLHIKSWHANEAKCVLSNGDAYIQTKQ